MWSFFHRNSKKMQKFFFQSVIFSTFELMGKIVARLLDLNIGINSIEKIYILSYLRNFEKCKFYRNTIYPLKKKLENENLISRVENSQFFAYYQTLKIV